MLNTVKHPLALEPWEKFTAEEKLEYEGVDIQHDLIDLDSVNWEGLSDKYYSFWADEMNCRTYVSWRSVLGKKGKKPRANASKFCKLYVARVSDFSYKTK